MIQPFPEACREDTAPELVVVRQHVAVFGDFGPRARPLAAVF